MGKQLSNSQLRRLSNIEETVDFIGRHLKSLSREALTGLISRIDVGVHPDGYRSNTALGDKTSGSSSSNSPTESASFSRMRKGNRDEVGEAWRRIEVYTKSAESLISECVGTLTYVSHIEEETRGRDVSSVCPICNELPAARSGFCDLDFQDWLLHGRPDRHLWCLWKTQTKNSEGLILVTSCPRPTIAAVFRGPFALAGHEIAKSSAEKNHEEERLRRAGMVS
jgi:hypothetical protein